MSFWNTTAKRDLTTMWTSEHKCRRRSGAIMRSDRVLTCKHYLITSASFESGKWDVSCCSDVWHRNVRSEYNAPTVLTCWDATTMQPTVLTRWDGNAADEASNLWLLCLIVFLFHDAVWPCWDVTTMQPTVLTRWDGNTADKASTLWLLCFNVIFFMMLGDLCGGFQL